MEASADDLGAPDSWEVADLDVSMTCLMLPSKKNPTFGSESLEESTASAAASSSPLFVDVEQKGGPSEDALNSVDQFLREALQNPRERLSILRMEQDVLKFIRDPTQQQLEFQQLPTSYLRLAAHRVAQHYNLQSSVMLDNNFPDGSCSRIIVWKTSDCRLPLVRLVDVPVSLPQDDSNNVIKVAIKQRGQKNSQTTDCANTHTSKENHAKSVEERKEEYNRARARIFSSSNSGDSSGGRPLDESLVLESLQNFSLTSTRVDEKSSVDLPEADHGRDMVDSSTGSSSSSSRPSRSKEEKEPVTRLKVNSRVAIFRDHEVDRKDPDYDRSYERYMRRFDPGFGFNGGQYTMQPMYSHSINYNMEFPHLGSAQRPQISIEHQPRPVPLHLRGPWTTSSNPAAIGYPQRPENLVPPPTFNPSQVGPHSTSAIYMHSQYACPHPGMAFIHPEHVYQPFVQPHHQQPEASYGLARPS